MRTLSPLVGSLLLVAASAYAAPVFDVTTVSCTGSQALSLGDTVSLSCSGDLSLTGGTISASSKVELSSFTSLSIDQVTISAPEVDLFVSFVSLGAGTHINANSIIVSSGDPGQPPSVSIAGGVGLTAGTGADGRILLLPDVVQNGDSGFITNPGSITLSSSVPEPSAWVLLLVELAGILATARGLKRA